MKHGHYGNVVLAAGCIEEKLRVAGGTAPSMRVFAGHMCLWQEMNDSVPLQAPVTRHFVSALEWRVCHTLNNSLEPARVHNECRERGPSTRQHQVARRGPNDLMLQQFSTVSLSAGPVRHCLEQLVGCSSWKDGDD
eukprot:3673229-Amphidinium_carterae.1